MKKLINYNKTKTFYLPKDSTKKVKKEVTPGKNLQST